MANNDEILINNSWEKIERVSESDEFQPPSPKWHDCKAYPTAARDG